jgi:hypothetical protein
MRANVVVSRLPLPGSLNPDWISSTASVSDLSDAERSKAWGEVYECLRQFEANGGFQTEVELIIGSGARRS